MLKRFGVASLILTMAAALLVVDITPAAAQNCNSVCNQIRRACRRIAKTTKNTAQAVCDDTRDGCRTDCDTNAATCPDSCSGLADPELTECLDACAQCKSTCNANRVVCRAAAKAVQDTNNLGCDDLRTSCGQSCMDPIDSTCVRSSRVTRRGCDANAKKKAVVCKRACTQGPGRRACVRSCRAQLNIDLGLCSDTEVSDLAACAGITL
jgi:hypothetical protein